MAISTLTGLKCLDLQETEIDGSAMPYINKLTNLQYLKASGTKIRGDELAKFPGLSKLNNLTASGLVNASALVRHLSPQSSLTVLFLAVID